MSVTLSQFRYPYTTPFTANLLGPQVRDPSHIKVVGQDSSGVEVSFTYNTDYTVTGVGNPSTTVTLTATGLSKANASATYIAVITQIPATQPDSYLAYSNFPPTAAQATWDLAALRDQRLLETLDRCPKYPDWENYPSNVYPNKTDRALKLSGWDASGNPTTYDSSSIITKAGVVAEYASVASMQSDSSVTSYSTGQTLQLNGYYSHGDFGQPIFPKIEASAAGAKSWVLNDGRYANLYLAGWANVKWFGAKGSGTSSDGINWTHPDDDTVPIEEATNALDGGVLFFPKGSYKVTRQLLLTVSQVNWRSPMWASVPDGIDSVDKTTRLVAQIAYIPSSGTDPMLIAYSNVDLGSGQDPLNNSINILTGNGDNRIGFGPYRFEGFRFLSLTSNLFQFGHKNGSGQTSTQTRIMQVSFVGCAWKGATYNKNTNVNTTTFAITRGNYTFLECYLVYNLLVANSGCQNGEYGLWIQNCDHPVIRECRFVAQNVSIYLINNITGNAIANTIINCEFEGAPFWPILVRGTVETYIYNCRIENGYDAPGQDAIGSVQPLNETVNVTSFSGSGDVTWTFSSAMDNILFPDETLCEIIDPADTQSRYYLIPKTVSGTSVTFYTDDKFKTTWVNSAAYVTRVIGGLAMINNPQDVSISNISSSIHNRTVIGRLLAFTSGGTYEIMENDIITGASSTVTARVAFVFLTSGSWSAGTAAGNLVLVSQSGAFVAENLDVGANLNVATISADSAASAIHTASTSDDFKQPPAFVIDPNPSEKVYLSDVDILQRERHYDSIIAGLNFIDQENQLGKGGINCVNVSRFAGFDPYHPYVKGNNTPAYSPFSESSLVDTTRSNRVPYGWDFTELQDRPLRRWLWTPKNAGDAVIPWRQVTINNERIWSWDFTNSPGTPFEFKTQSLPNSDDGLYMLRVKAIGLNGTNTLGVTAYGNTNVSKSYSNISTSVVSIKEIIFRPSDVDWLSTSANSIGINTTTSQVAVVSVELMQITQGSNNNLWPRTFELVSGIFDLTQAVGTSSNLDMPDTFGTLFSIFPTDWSIECPEASTVTTRAQVELGDSGTTNRFGTLIAPDGPAKVSYKSVPDTDNSTKQTQLQWRISVQGVAGGNYTGRLRATCKLIK